MLLPPPTSTLFPYTTLFRSQLKIRPELIAHILENAMPRVAKHQLRLGVVNIALVPVDVVQHMSARHEEVDRKSTRLNSSHTVISYAVFCLKKKKKKSEQTYI